MNAAAGRSDRPDPNEIWRTWLITGARAHGIDRRRLRGAHRGIKQMLAEGGEPDAVSRPWGNFSHAMVRQHVSEGMGRLSPRDRVVITMAYFAGFTNTEIADELGLSARAVQRSLSKAVADLSHALERGRRAALGVAIAIAGGRAARWLTETVAPAGAQAVAAAVVVGTVAATPAPALTPPATGGQAPAGAHSAPTSQAATTPAAAPQSTAHAAPAPSSTAPAGTTSASTPSAGLPVPVQTPAVPQVRLPLPVPSVPPIKPPKLPKV